MTSKASVLVEINSILNVVLNFSSNSAHSEYFEMIRRLYSKLNTLVLTSIVFQEFNDVFQRFSFSFKWDRIQSSTIHIKSWSMNECEKTFLIIFILLRDWLKFHHLKKKIFMNCNENFSCSIEKTQWLMLIL